MLTDPEKLNAALKQLEAEKKRRIQARVDTGRLVRVPLFVSVGEPEEVDAAIEAAKARKLAELREAGEKREIIFDEPMVFITGVPRSPGFGKWEASPLPKEAAPEPREDLAETNPPDVATEPRSVWIQVRPASENDPGAIAEGTYTIERGAVHVSDIHGKLLASQTLGPGDDPKGVARRLLRENRKGFWDPIPLPNFGVV